MASFLRATLTPQKLRLRGLVLVSSWLWLPPSCVHSSSKERTMADYPINRGIGKPVEFRGLKSQYLFIFAGGLLALFVLFIIMYMVGINQWVCIIFGVTSATLLVWLTFRLNEKYGTHGLMKLSARKSHPFHIINRRAISRLFTKNQKQASKWEIY